MNTEHLSALLAQVNDDPDLQARFKAITTEADFNALTAELGYEVTDTDYAGTPAVDTELSDSELADVTGGFAGMHAPPSDEQCEFLDSLLDSIADTLKSW